LPAFVEGDVQNQLDSNSRAAVRKAQLAAARMTVRYRSLFLGPQSPTRTSRSTTRSQREPTR
jgi:hypothetical protein